jgi:hypothetical protein
VNCTNAPGTRCADTDPAQRPETAPTATGSACREMSDGHGRQSDVTTIHVFELAKELGKSSREIVNAAHALTYSNIVSASARLKPEVADAIRRLVKQEREDRERRLARIPAPLARESGSPPVPHRDARSAECSCCSLRFTYVPAIGRDVPERCPACAGHYEILGEDSGRALARAQDHEKTLRTVWEFAARKANDYEQRMKGALRSRDGWKAALVEVMLAHDQSKDGCTCGAKVYPCFTVKKLEEANPGIARRVEFLGTLNDKDRNRELYRDDDDAWWRD